MTVLRGRHPRSSTRPSGARPTIGWVTPGARSEADELARLHRLAEHAANLTRLNRRIATLREGQDKRIGGRLRAALTAYDQTLLLAVLEAGIPDSGDRLCAPLHAADRLGLEAELALLGVRW
jgi:hypothetical protein